MERERHCRTCGQLLPEQARRDPPLPPLEHPSLVTIHDLPEKLKSKVRVVEKFGTKQLVLPVNRGRG